MAHVRDGLIPGRFNDEVDQRWQVFQTHIFLIEVPILTILVVERQVHVTVAIASVVAHPDIVSGAGQNEGICSLRIVPHPFHVVTVLSMHHEDGGLLRALLYLTECAGDTIQ